MLHSTLQLLFLSGSTTLERPFVKIEGAKGQCSYTLNGSFDCSKRFFFNLEGWRSNNTRYGWKMVRLLREKGHSAFLVDWTKYSMDSLYFFIDIASAGNCLAEAIDKEIASKCPHQPDITLIGVSLSCHITAVTSRRLRTRGTEVRRIIAQDPAIFPCDTWCLRKSDAEQVVHLITNRGIFGVKYEVGTVNFYANGGLHQPGCPLSDDIYSNMFTCDHRRSLLFTLEAIETGGFVGRECKLGTFYPELVTNGSVLEYNMDIPLEAKGSYCFNTRRKTPFALG